MRPGRVNRGRESEDTGFRRHPALRRSRKAPVLRLRPALSNWEIINARRPTGGERARASARHPASSPIPSVCRYRGVSAPSLPRCWPAATALLPNLEAGRTLDAKTLREAMSAGLRRQRHARRLGLEGRLRSSRPSRASPAMKMTTAMTAITSRRRPIKQVRE